MGWARFDDQYSDHPKVVKAGPMAELLDMRAVIYCARYETDGWLTREALARLGAGIPKVVQKAKALVESGRWHATDHVCGDCPEVFGDGFYVHNFLKYNPSSEAKESDREAARERMRRARQGKRSPRSSAEHNTNTDRSSDNPVPVPDPVPLRNSSSDALRAEPEDVADEKLRVEATARAALVRVVEERLKTRAPDNPDAYRRTVTNEVERDLGDRCRRIVATHDGNAPLDAIVAALLGQPSSLRFHQRPQEATA